MAKGNGDQPPEEMLWKSAIKLRTNMDAASYKHPVLGLIFLKYISDAFDAHRAHLQVRYGEPASEDYVDDPDELAELLEDRDEYRADNVFWVPPDGRWAKVEKAPAENVARTMMLRWLLSKPRTRRYGVSFRASTRVCRCARRCCTSSSP